jgi:phosphoribosylformylglycinamidine synthase
MCLGGDMGVSLHLPAGLSVPAHAFLYGEDQARYLVATGVAEELLAAAAAANVPAVRLGYSGGPALTVEGVLSIPLADLKEAHEAWLPDYMSGAAA